MPKRKQQDECQESSFAWLFTMKPEDEEFGKTLFLNTNSPQRKDVTISKINARTPQVKVNYLNQSRMFTIPLVSKFDNLLWKYALALFIDMKIAPPTSVSIQLDIETQSNGSISAKSVKKATEELRKRAKIEFDCIVKGVDSLSGSETETD